MVKLIITCAFVSNMFQLAKGQTLESAYNYSDMVIIVNNRPCIYQKVFFVKYLEGSPVDSLGCVYTPGALRIGQKELANFKLAQSDSTLLAFDYADPDDPNMFTLFTFRTDIEITENDYNVLKFMNTDYLDQFEHKKKPKSGYLVEFWIGQIHSFETKYLKWEK